VIRTNDVARRTTLLLLRVRYLVYERKHVLSKVEGDEQPSLAEETISWGIEGLPPDSTPLTMARAKQLFDESHAQGNVADSEKREVLRETLGWWDQIQPALKQTLDERTTELSDAHQRVRQLLGQRRVHIEPQLPTDLIGVLVLLPVV
jgi:hypothetical protein